MHNLLVAAGFAGLMLLLLPVKRWQVLLLKTISHFVRLMAIAVVIAGFGLYLYTPPVLVERVGEFEPSLWLPVTGLVVFAAIPLVAFMDFTRRLYHIGDQVQHLEKSANDVGGLVTNWLDDSAGNTATLTPERKAELRTAFNALQNDRPRVRRATLAELVRN